jgi:hypothetical protein
MRSREDKSKTNLEVLLRDIKGIPHGPNGGQRGFLENGNRTSV